MNTLSHTPEKIGRYPVLRVLGRGAMGCVYLARDEQLDRDVAIKTVRLPQGVREQDSFLVRFRNEARAVGRLRHRSIVSVYDVGNDPESGPFLVFEYIEGANLKDILRSRGPLPPGDVVSIAEQVGEALTAAHREGIIHRDIKPENLLVDRDQVVHLADFGVARVPDAALTGEGQFLGTPCYGAPETLRGGEASPLSDQFSFAAVLYELVCGARAFPGSNAVAVAHAVIHDEPKPPSKLAEPPVHVPDEVDEVILRALSKDPRARYASVMELVFALRSAYARAAGVGTDPLGTVPALLHSPRPPASVRAQGERKLPLWPIAVFLGVGAVALVQLASSDATRGADDTLSDAALPIVPTQGHTSLVPGELQASGATDAAVSDANAAGSDDAEAASVEVLSSFEREERAKDALERAEKALARGDRAAAEAALDEAFKYDPEHPDIAALRRQL